MHVVDERELCDGRLQSCQNRVSWGKLCVAVMRLRRRVEQDHS